MAGAKEVEGATVLVTGASRGLGRSIATAFAAEGAFVGIGYHLFDRAAGRTLAAIEEGGGHGALVKADVSDYRAVEQAISEFCKLGGDIDILVNNAAIVDDKPFVLMSSESWHSVVGINLGGVFNCSRAVIPSMMARRKGSIVNIGSVASIVGNPGQANYVAAKGGAMALTRTLARELGPYGIRVNAVVPGPLTVGMGKHLPVHVARSTRLRIPLGRFGESQDVVAAVLFLASNDASYVTGQQLVVDGGFSL